MKILKTKKEVKKFILSLKAKNKKIGFVPTMGYLHQGHITLMDKAVQECDVAVASIFVNPIQFGKNEDIGSYPCDLENDKKLLKKAGVKAVFIPTVKEMFGDNFSTSVIEHSLTSTLCGSSRPTHFEGVTTIVLKLLNIVAPNIAYFGNKDRQQLLVIKKMVKDLDIDVVIKGIATVREKDGLALSSRNKYLSDNQRESALILSQSIKKVKAKVKEGQRSTAVLLNMVKRDIEKTKYCDLDYARIVDVDTLRNIKKIENKALFALAVKVGKARLIDNDILKV